MTLPIGRFVAAPALNALPLGRFVVKDLDADTAAALTGARVGAYVDRFDQLWRWDAFKVRYVRTPAGARRYGVPIGSPIPVGRKVKPKTSGAGGGTARPAPNRVQLAPKEKAAAQRAFGGDNADRHGASVNDRGELEVHDRAKAQQRLNDIARHPSSSDEDRKAAAGLQRRIDVLPPDEPRPDAHPEGGPADEVSRDAAPNPEAPAADPEPASDSTPPSNERVHGAELTDDYRARVQLSDDEKAAVGSYTGGGYSGINQMLRGQSIDDAVNNDPAQVQREIDAMNAVMSRYTTTGTILAHRSIYSDGGGTGLPAGDISGQVITSPGFVSTAVDEPAPGFKHGQDHMEITIPPGMHGIDVGGSAAGAFGDREREFILPHNTRFRVDSVEYREVDGEPQRLLRVTALPPVVGVLSPS